MTVAILELPGSPKFTMSDVIGDGTTGPWQDMGDRVRVCGSDINDQIMSYGFEDYTIAAGVPQTINTASIKALNGAALSATSGRVVYLAIRQRTGINDMLVRKSAANAIVIGSGTTETQPIHGQKVLVDVHPSSDLLVSGAPAWDATHRDLDIESVAGGIVRVMIGVC